MGAECLAGSMPDCTAGNGASGGICDNYGSFASGNCLGNGSIPTDACKGTGNSPPGGCKGGSLPS